MVGRGGRLFFAPGIGFDQVDPSDAAFPGQFEHRIESLYLTPAQDCVRNDHAFAAGAVLVSCTDALARFKYGRRATVHDRFTDFASTELRSFGGQLSERFYDEFRNGLVHEARLKLGAQFSFDLGQTVGHSGPLMIINPAHLLDEVRDALRTFVALASSNVNEHKKLASAFVRDHITDFRASNSPYVR
jgi:hypothetical protein